MKYLNEDGLQVVADKINTRLKTVTEMPLSANDGAVRLYIGTDGTYLKGHIYKMVSNLYHMWRVSSRIVYTKGRTPSVGDIIYDWDGTVYTDSGNTVVEVDGTNYITSSNGMTYGDYGTQGEENWTDITASGGTVDLNFDPVSENAQSGIAVSQALGQIISNTTIIQWNNKTWQGLTDFYGFCIWNDGENLYYSYNNKQYVFNESNKTWESKTWYGLTNFVGEEIWKDGDNIYYSNESQQYVLNKATDTWETKTWYGLTDFSAYRIWRDGDNIYYSNDTEQYVLNRATSTWEEKTWYGLTEFLGQFVWTDGDNIYFSSDLEQYVLNKATDTWESKTWNISPSDGQEIWTDGNDFYYLYFVLNRITSEWEEYSESQPTAATSIWSWKENIYYSNGGEQRVASRTIK